MGHAQLRDWINQWGSAWGFSCLEPGSSMTDVMKAFKKKALVLHPDKVPESEKADATLRMSALGNAKEILLSPGLRILHDKPPWTWWYRSSSCTRRSATSFLGSTASARTGALEPTQPFIVLIFEGATAGSLIELLMAESAGTFIVLVL